MPCVRLKNAWYLMCKCYIGSLHQLHLTVFCPIGGTSVMKPGEPESCALLVFLHPPPPNDPHLHFAQNWLAAIKQLYKKSYESEININFVNVWVILQSTYLSQLIQLQCAKSDAYVCNFRADSQQTEPGSFAHLLLSDNTELRGPLHCLWHCVSLLH